MRAALLATSLVLGACARHDASDGGAPGEAVRADAGVRDARSRTGVTQPAPGTAVPAGAALGVPVRDTPTPARPDSVPGAPDAGRAGATAVPAASARASESAGDAPPQMRGRLPFRYPSALYPGRVQGNVTLRLWVDSAGRVRPESTRVAESSGARLLDSAAVAGSVRLEFTPARRAGRPVAAPLLFPVHFRHPAANH